MFKTLNSDWHVLYVRSCQEKKVHELLKERKIESFLPLVKTITQWKDRKKIILKPLFPSYVFVKIDSLLASHNALDVRGACSFIKFGNDYAKVTSEEIANIRCIINNPDVNDIYIENQTITKNKKMIIKKGSLKGICCEIMDNNNPNKIRVRIDSLSQDLIIVLKENDLVKV